MAHPKDSRGEGEQDVKEEVNRTPGEVKEAQRVVGELIWLVTRCRPDIMYVTALMAALTTRRPLKVLRMAYQVWGYLAGTLKEGLVFQGVGGDLMVYTDASFGEEEAHGCVVVKWGEDPLIWRSSRQGMLTTSTAEAELVEVMEGAVTTEALRVMVEEVLERPVRCWQFTDSSSALTIIIGDTASWRTRHLRKRAKFLRWKALRGDILMRHQPGSEMVADIGTKPLSAVKLKEHKKRLGMNLQESEVKKKESPSTESTKKEGGRLRLALMMALIARGKAQKEGEKIKEGWEIEALILLYTVFVVMITVAFQAWCRWRSQKKKGLEDHTEEDPVCGLTPGLKKKPAKGIEERTEEEPVRGLSHEVEEDLRKRSKEDTGEPTVSKVQPTSQNEERKEGRATASSGGQVPNLPSEAFQRNKIPRESDAPSRGTSWMVAGNGLRYHRLRHCTGVKMSKQVRDVKICGKCLEENGGVIPRSPTLYANGINEVMHLSEDHYKLENPGRKPRTFDPCQVCKP